MYNALDYECVVVVEKVASKARLFLCSKRIAAKGKIHGLGFHPASQEHYHSKQDAIGAIYCELILTK